MTTLAGLAMAAVAVVVGPDVAASDEPAAAPAAPAVTVPERDVPRYEDGVIRYSSTYAERIGLRVEPVALRDLAPTTEVTGQIERSPEHVAAVGVQIFGRVKKVHVVPGQEVRKGQRLATLESAALGRAQAELASARAREALASADHERKQLLVSEGIAAHRSMELATNELEAAKALLRASKQSVRAMGGGTGAKAPLGKIVLRAPIAGEIVEASVYRGQAVEPDHLAFEIADFDQVWLHLAVFERDLSQVGEGDPVVVRPSGDPNTEVRGRVAHVGSVIDPVSRTAAVRVEIDNTTRALRVGQAVRARIESKGAEVRVPAVPRRAVVLVDGEPTVFVVPRQGEVTPRAVKLGVRSRDHVEVREGLAPGDPVVVDGVFELKSELFR